MASALLALLSQPTPSLQTRKGVIITSLQNDFLPNGKLPVSIPPGYFDKLRAFVLAFREFGDVIWVRSEFEADREVNSGDDGGNTVIIGPPAEVTYDETDDNDDDRDSPVPPKRPRVSFEETDRILTVSGEGENDDAPRPAVDEELFLRRTPTKEPCCLPGSHGAEFTLQVQSIIDSNKDLVITSTHYSAFGSTSLLNTIRMNLVTELFICGGPTNLSVYATAMDAARYALPITLIDDLLVARSPDRHDMAVKHLREVMEADVMTSEEVVEILKNPPSAGTDDDYDDVYEIEYGDVVNDVGNEDVILEEVLEVDDEEDEDEWMPDLSTSRPESSHLYDHLQGLRFTSPTARNAFQNVAGRPQYFAASAPSLTGGPNGELASGLSITRRFDNHSQDGKSEKLTAASLNDLHESSRRISVENWLAQGETVTAAPVSSSHPGLQAMASLGGLDQKTVDSYEELMEEAKDARRTRTQPLFGEGKEGESAGSCLVYNLLSPEMSATTFDKLKDEVAWQRMHHQTGEVPRLVCCQGTIGDDGSKPVYRHPSDQTLPTQSWTPTVDLVRMAAEEAVGHSLNHSLIQLYRGGTDYISEHSDKTLDIVKGSYIVNVSFGAQRTMRLRTKRAGGFDSENTSTARTTHRIPLPHNSLVKMSLATNAEYLHGINADKRPAVELGEAEKAFEGYRISLTFRNIGTFLNHDSTRIWGQGAKNKTPNHASVVINADAAESERLVRAFGAENQASSIQWEAIYGDGFDVLHLS